MASTRPDAAARRLRLIPAVRFAGFLCLIVDLVALGAHLIELPNKLAMSGPLWLQVQQSLYRGWGPFIGPFEAGAVVFAWLLAYLLRGRGTAFGLTLSAALCLTLTLALFFVVVQPVNTAFAGWTPETIPVDWAAYRLRWEYGHAARAVLAALAMTALVRAALIERHPAPAASEAHAGYAAR
ncbi:MAG: hypothetical protein ACFCUQ_01865 [Kiloniellales bacterium]